MNKKDIIKHIGKENWPMFLKFMAGQTYTLGVNGEPEYYSHDVLCFISLLEQTQNPLEETNENTPRRLRKTRKNSSKRISQTTKRRKI